MDYILFDDVLYDHILYDHTLYDHTLYDHTLYDHTLYNNLFYEVPHIKNVISEEEFNKLEKKHYSIDNQSNSTCPITQIEFLKDEEIIELPCSHIFNPSAIKKWLMEESGECPVCRYKFTTIQVQAEQAQAEQAQAEQAQAEQAQAEQAQAEEENLRYNPTEFNDIFNNFMETTVVYVYINNNIYV